MAAESLQKIWSVAGLTRAIGGELSDFGTITVRGELSQAKVASSGHWYATLKDSQASLSLVMWKSTVVRAGALPRDGTLVEVRGSLEVYAPRGSYSLITTRVAPLGAGDLAAKFEELKAKLTAEGLFDADRKVALPMLPRAVGLATASGSAALADMLDSLRARFPSMPIVVAPCVVQGAGAVAAIVNSIRLLDAHPAVDVIIVGRGGGSLEDLWAFNDEAVVRAVAACRTPIVSAVGHETDTVLSDFAADARAKTPTAAAERVVPVERDLREAIARARLAADRAITQHLAQARAVVRAAASHRVLLAVEHLVSQRARDLDEARDRLTAAMDDAIDAAQRRLDRARHGLAMAAPDASIALRRQHVADAARRLRAALAHRVERSGDRVAAAAGRLHAMSPLAVLGRGYAVIHRDAGRDQGMVRSIADTVVGDHLRLRLRDGAVRATVVAVEQLAPGETMRD